MFLPLVTKRRLPTTLAPVVSPTSCLIEPMYSTLSDDTQSGPVWLAAATDAVDRQARAATSVARRVRIPVQRDRSPLLLRKRIVRDRDQRIGPAAVAAGVGDPAAELDFDVAHATTRDANDRDHPAAASLRIAM